MDDLDRQIIDIYCKLLPTLSQAELKSRLARRNTGILKNPPRPWCFAIRASDRRINNDTAILSSYRAVDRDHPEAHSLTIDHALLKTLAQPAELYPIMDWTDVAKRLGVHPESMRRSMKNGFFRVEHRKLLGGKRGHPVPVFLNYQTLDPTSGRLHQPPDPLWGGLWPWAADRLPKDFQQTVRRIPVYRPYRGQLRFRGYRFACPTCEKRVRTLFYPLPPLNLPRYFNHDPATRLAKSQNVGLASASETSDAPDTLEHESSSAFSVKSSAFACHTCHHIRYFSRMSGRDAWNHFITHVTAGLLYGHEVPRPKDFDSPEKRKRKYRPNLLRPPSKRRQQVLDRLLQGLTYDEIAQDLGVGYPTVHIHVKTIYKQNNVHSRQQLARRLNHRLPNPTSKKRAAVQHLLEQGATYKQIARSLNTTLHAVHHHATNIYRHHNVRGRKHLIQKLRAQIPEHP
jgi:DNA-binding NarL/FixJ family response regulator